MAHGAEAAAEAEKTARHVFAELETGRYSLKGHPLEVQLGLPTLTLTPADLGENGISVVQLFVRSGLAGSGKEAKRLIAEGGARLDDEPVTEAGMMLGPDRFARPLKLSAGKKRHALARLG